MAPIFTAQTGDAAGARADALIVPIGAGEAAPASIAGAFDGQLAGVLEAAGFTGKRGNSAAFATFGRLPARTLVLAGTGERPQETGRWGEALRRAYGAAVRRARSRFAGSSSQVAAASSNRSESCSW